MKHMEKIEKYKHVYLNPMGHHCCHLAKSRKVVKGATNHNFRT